jgi:Protein of unknown function (DUF2628)
LGLPKVVAFGVLPGHWFCRIFEAALDRNGVRAMLLRLLFGNESVQSFTVHEAPSPAAARIARAEALVFVKDGFTWPAFLGAPVWLASEGMWIWLAGYVASVLATVGLVALFDLPLPFLGLALLALHLLVGFEADDLKRGALEADGFTTLGAVTGKGALECERRFFDIWLGGAAQGGDVAPSAGVDAGRSASASTGFIKSTPSSSRPRIIGDLLGLGRR